MAVTKVISLNNVIVKKILQNLSKSISQKRYIRIFPEVLILSILTTSSNEILITGFRKITKIVIYVHHLKFQIPTKWGLKLPDAEVDGGSYPARNLIDDPADPPF